MYFHELTTEEKKQVFDADISVGEFMEKYKQPDWCGYQDALRGLMGCWSLMQVNSPVSCKYCRGCGGFKMEHLVYEEKEMDEQLKKLTYKGKFVENWFSNFVSSPIIIDDLEWPNVEAYFAAQKTLDTSIREEIRLAKTPGQAKKIGRTLTLRKDWEQIKDGVMEKALRVKFALGTEWHKKLLATKNQLIIEWNNWGDQYWGKTLDKKGKNKLGELLMLIRNESF